MVKRKRYLSEGKIRQNRFKLTSLKKSLLSISKTMIFSLYQWFIYEKSLITKNITRCDFLRSNTITYQANFRPYQQFIRRKTLISKYNTYRNGGFVIPYCFYQQSFPISHFIYLRTCSSERGSRIFLESGGFRESTFLKTSGHPSSQPY